MSEIDGTLNITIPKDLRKAYCKAPGWCDLLGNVSFILIQRYNRPRLLRLAEKENKKNL